MFYLQTIYTSIDHHWKNDTFVTCGGSSVHVWDEQRSEPVRNFEWGEISVQHVKFNPVEVSIEQYIGVWLESPQGKNKLI